MSAGADCSLEVLHSLLDVLDGKYFGSDADEESELLLVRQMLDIQVWEVGGSRTRPL